MHSVVLHKHPPASPNCINHWHQRARTRPQRSSWYSWHKRLRSANHTPLSWADMRSKQEPRLSRQPVDRCRSRSKSTSGQSVDSIASASKKSGIRVGSDRFVSSLARSPTTEYSLAFEAHVRRTTISVSCLDCCCTGRLTYLLICCCTVSVPRPCCDTRVVGFVRIISYFLPALPTGLSDRSID